MNCSSFSASALNSRMPSAVFSVAIAFSLNSQRNFFSSNCSRPILLSRREVGTEFARDGRGAFSQFPHQLRADGQQIAAGQFKNFARVAETRAHDLRRVPNFL